MTVSKQKGVVHVSFLSKNSIGLQKMQNTEQRSIAGWLFGVYGISTFAGHSNSVYIYIHIQPKISKRILRWVEFSISRSSFVCTRLTSFKLSYFLVQLCQRSEKKSFNYLIDYHFTLLSFSHQREPMVSHWILCGSKSPQVFRTLLSILANLNNAIFWIVSSRLLISMSPRLFINLLVTVPSATITIGITVKV